MPLASTMDHLSEHYNQQSVKTYEFDPTILRRLHVGEARVDGHEVSGNAVTVVDKEQSLYGIIDERESYGEPGVLAAEMKTTFVDIVTTNFDSNNPIESMRNAMHATQKSVRQSLGGRFDEVTISASFIKFFRDNGTLKAAYAHVGDTRILKRSRDDSDHSKYAITAITEDEGNAERLHNAFGRSSFDAQQVGVIDMQPNDRIVLINSRILGDDAHSSMDPSSMVSSMEQPNPVHAARQFVEQGSRRSDKVAVVVDVPETSSRLHLMSSKILGFLGMRSPKSRVIYRNHEPSTRTATSTVYEPIVNSVPFIVEPRDEIRDPIIVDEPVYAQETVVANNHRGTEREVVETRVTTKRRNGPVIFAAIGGLLGGMLIANSVDDPLRTVEQKTHFKQGVDVLPTFIDGDGLDLHSGDPTYLVEKVTATPAPVIQVRPNIVVKVPDISVPPAQVTVVQNPAPAPQAVLVSEPAPQPSRFYIERGSSYVQEIHKLGHELAGKSFKTTDAVVVLQKLRAKFGNQLLAIDGHPGNGSYVYKNDLRISAPGYAQWGSSEIENTVKDLIRGK